MKYQHFLSNFTCFLLLTISMLIQSCQSSQTEPVELVFAFGPDESGTVQQLIDDFNKEYAGSIHVSWNKGSRFSDAFYHEIAAEFESGAPAIDVIASDVIWTPSFAAKGWTEDLTQRFFAEFEPNSFIESAMGSVSYKYKVWGLPWYTDAGMLYYRKDLLEDSGYDSPPVTWDELIEYAQKVGKDSGLRTGYVFQGGDYEGGVTNACEFIWNAGGNILLGDLSTSTSFDENVPEPDLITVNSPQARMGFEKLEKIMGSGIVPLNIHEYREKECTEAFQEGRAIFMRTWASGFGSLLHKGSKLNADQVGISTIPTAQSGQQAYSCLGGWNLMISAMASPEKKEAAWTFVKYMADEKAQRFRALNAGILPSLRQLYSDQEILKKAPVVAFAKEVIPNGKERPRSPFYMEMSPEISSVYSMVIRGNLTPEVAVAELQNRLEAILEKHQKEARIATVQ